MSKITDEMRRKSAEARSDPSKICGAPAKKGKGGICHNWAGARTDHLGTGYCYRHDKQLAKVETVDLVLLSEQESQDPEILELRREIELARGMLGSLGSGGDEDGDGEIDVRAAALLLDTIRKLVQTKNRIELERRYLIPVSVAVNMARRLTELIAGYLPQEQRFALREEVVTLLRTELALDSKGAWTDPAARWSRNKP